MEEILIYKVKDRRELYDSKVTDYKDPKVRNKAWSEIAVELGITAAKCREMWYKLRNGYNASLKKRLSNKDQVPSPTKWKYEDLMSFLLPHMVGVNRNRLDKLIYEEPSSPVEDGINYTIDETVVDTTGDDNENSNSSVNECTAKPSTSNDCTEKITMSLSNNEESISDDRNSTEEQSIHLKPKSGQQISVVNLNNLKDSVSNIKKISPEKETIDLTDQNSNLNILKRKSNESSAYSYLTLEIKANVSKRNGSYDDAKEDEFYMRMAKMAKTLKMSDRIKLRETVANAVMEAMMDSLK